jgi:hypothetical protein
VAITLQPTPTKLPTQERTNRTILGWCGLAAILALYCLLVTSIHPTNLFGLMEDDTIYFSSARELAQGHGYVLSNLPGQPAATKYPILYPWLLSWVWRLNPSFPQNLALAVAVSVSWGCVFIVASFLFFQRIAGFGQRESLALTTFCALTPNWLLAGLVMSDVPFAALCLIAFLLASLTDEQRGNIWAGASGALAGAAMLVRALGAPVAAGIFLGIARRSGWKKGFAFAAAFLPFSILMLLGHKTPIPQVHVPPDCQHSWQMTWLYYTNYIEFWKADTLQNAALWPALRSNVFLTVLQPGSYVLNGASVLKWATVSTPVLLTVSAVIVRGIVRQIQTQGMQPFHWAFLFYMGPVFLWDSAIPSRFLLPFLPLFFAGLWTEIRRLAGPIRDSWHGRRRVAARLAAALVCLVAGMFGAVSAVSWWSGFRQLTSLSEARGRILAEKKEAYRWLRENTPEDARVIAHEDVLAHFYSARIAVRPIIFSPAGAERRDLLDGELDRLSCNAAAVGARYWLVADDDFAIEYEPAKSLALAREKALAPGMRLLFRSTLGRVRIYALSPEFAPGS